MSTVRSSAPRGEDFILTLGGGPLTVRVKRHHAARRYRLRYDAREGELRLTMPPRQRLAPARAWVAAQGEWIAVQVAARPAGGMNVAAGTSLPWRDATLLIDWRPDAARAPALKDDRLIVGGPQASVPARVQRWLQELARIDLSARSRRMAAAERLPLTAVSIGDPRGRWGSCSARGAIRYNWRLVMAPDAVRHAIVAHEVAHLAHMNHGPRFHALADRLAGEAGPGSRAWLKAHGASLQALRFGA